MMWSTYTIGAYSPGEAMLVIAPRGWSPGSSADRPIVLCFHGHGANALQYIPGTTFTYPGPYALALVRAGYVVASIDAGGPTPWGSPGEMTIIDAAYDSIVSMGMPGARVAIMGWSMGGGSGLIWTAANPDKVGPSWYWTPACDIVWAHGDKPSPPWSGSFAPNASWPAEIDAAYAGAAVADTNPMDHPERYRGLDFPITIATATDDTVLPPAMSPYFVTQVDDPMMSFRSVASGGHSGLFAEVPTDDVVSFYQQTMPAPAA